MSTTQIRPDVVARPRTRKSVTPATSNATSVEAATYEVGYRKPPSHTRFKPGQSSNPKGRPKGARSVKTIVREIMNQKVTVRSGGVTRRMRRIEALTHRIVEDAFAGKVRDRQTLLAFYEDDVAKRERRDAARQSEASAQPVDLDTHDDAILKAMQEMLVSALRGS